MFRCVGLRSGKIAFFNGSRPPSTQSRLVRRARSLAFCWHVVGYAATYSANFRKPIASLLRGAAVFVRRLHVALCCSAWRGRTRLPPRLHLFSVTLHVLTRPVFQIRASCALEPSSCRETRRPRDSASPPHGDQCGDYFAGVSDATSCCACQLASTAAQTVGICSGASPRAAVARLTVCGVFGMHSDACLQCRLCATPEPQDATRAAAAIVGHGQGMFDAEPNVSPDIRLSDGLSRRSTRSSMSSLDVPRMLEDLAVTTDVINDSHRLPHDECTRRLFAVAATTQTVRVEDETARRRLAAFDALPPVAAQSIELEMKALRGQPVDAMPLRVAGRGVDERLSLGDMIFIANSIETLASALERQLPTLFADVRAATVDGRKRRKPLSTVELLMQVVRIVFV